MKFISMVYNTFVSGQRRPCPLSDWTSAVQKYSKDPIFKSGLNTHRPWKRIDSQATCKMELPTTAAGNQDFGDTSLSISPIT